MPHSLALASYLARLRLEDLPAEAVRLLKLCVLALERGKVLPADFEPQAMRDPERERIARATAVVAAPALTAIYEERKPCDVTLHLRDGRTLRERVDFCRGEPEHPPTEETVVAKFSDLSSGHLARDAAREFIDIVLSIEKQVDLRRLGELLQEAT